MALEGQPERGQQGLYYYYLMMARTLQVLDVDNIVTPDGVSHPWAKELAAQLLSVQHEDGTWSNPVDRFMEAVPAVVTAYSVRALTICREQLK